MTWSIRKDGELLLAADKDGAITGLMASSYNGYVSFGNQLRLPTGPTIKFPPKNSTEDFVVAYHYLANSEAGPPFEMTLPSDLDDYLGESFLGTVN